MLGRPHAASRLASVAMLAASLMIAPVGWLGEPAVAADTCTTTEDVRATSCRLLDGAMLEGTLADTSASATYRVDTLAADATLDLALTALNGSAHIAVMDWHGAILAEAASSDPGSEARVDTSLPLPGTYLVRVAGMSASDDPVYRIAAKITYPGAVQQALWPTTLARADGPLNGERQMLRTPRGGTAETGVAVARAVQPPPEGRFGDFVLVADVQFERIVGPSALSLRFRFEPEAGGGTGYVLEIDPFAGTASLDGFDAGQRHAIVSRVPLPVVPTEQGPNRLILQATGPKLTVTLDGQPVLEAIDARYPSGLLVVGVVTWSDPVAVTFDHLQVTGPPR